MLARRVKAWSVVVQRPVSAEHTVLAHFKQYVVVDDGPLFSYPVELKARTVAVAIQKEVP